MFNWLHTYLPQPILLRLGPIEIHWYGFLIALGAFLGFLVLLYLIKQYGIKKDDFYNLAFWVIIFGLIGDRLYYVFYAWEYYSSHLLDIFKIWEGGLAIHGAMIAGILVTYIYCKKHKLNPWQFTDLFVVALALAMVFGRWGNYFNMELFGTPTDLPWGIPIIEAKRPGTFASAQYFHPTFLYESIWNLGTFIILFIWHKLRLNKNNPQQIKGYGNITLVYFFLYSIGRFLTEFLRTDYSPYFLGIRWAQFASLVIIFLVLALFLMRLMKKYFIKQD